MANINLTPTEQRVLTYLRALGPFRFRTARQLADELDLPWKDINNAVMSLWQHSLCCQSFGTVFLRPEQLNAPDIGSCALAHILLQDAKTGPRACAADCLRDAGASALGALHEQE